MKISTISPVDPNCHPPADAPAPCARNGFTLVELLVVIVIIAALALLSFTVATRMIKSARITAEIANLRQSGQAISISAVDAGYFPMGWDGNQALSWAGVLVKESNSADSKITQADYLWSPVLKVKVPLTQNIATVTHFTVNPAIMTDVDESSTSTPKAPKFIIRQSQLQRPSEQILMAGVVPRDAVNIYKSGHAMSWALRALIGGNGGGGNPPSRNPANSEKPIDFPADIKNLSTGSLPDFNRYGDGKGRFYFVDGHIQVMAPSELKQKHFAVSY
jgi:prepilin-type N-terminal cleavage/methylation domain-containing protein